MIYSFVVNKILGSRVLLMNILKSAHKNKSSVFNGLQAKLTGSNPVALTTFPLKGCGSQQNDLSNNSLKKIT